MDFNASLTKLRKEGKMERQTERKKDGKRKKEKKKAGKEGRYEEERKFWVKPSVQRQG